MFSKYAESLTQEIGVRKLINNRIETILRRNERIRGLEIAFTKFFDLQIVI